MKWQIHRAASFAVVYSNFAWSLSSILLITCMNSLLNVAVCHVLTCLLVALIACTFTSLSIWISLFSHLLLFLVLHTFTSTFWSISLIVWCLLLFLNSFFLCIYSLPFYQDTKGMLDTATCSPPHSSPCPQSKPQTLATLPTVTPPPATVLPKPSKVRKTPPHRHHHKGKQTASRSLNQIYVSSSSTRTQARS